MAAKPQFRPSERLLVVMPTWVGDCVMAMPTLAALRGLYPQARISALVKDPVRPIVDGCPWMDRILTIRKRRKGMGDSRRGIFNLARRLSKAKFDTAVLLPNSFRAALLATLAGIPRKVGYDRDSRGTMLTDRLLPLRSAGKFVPVPTLDYYLGVARYLGATDCDPKLRLFTRPDDDARADALLAKSGHDVNATRPLVILNCGANYGDAKLWPAERFARVGDDLADRHGATVAISGAPRERKTLDKVLAAARRPMIDLQALGLDLFLLKSIVRRASLMVTNDTGPRHIAAALGVPVVTVFGPTDPAWTTIPFEAERQVMVKVFCGPCQLKKCPLDHRCMTQITPDMVLARCEELLARKPSHSDGGVPGGAAP